MKKQLTTTLLLIAMLAAVGCGESASTVDTGASGDTTTAEPVETRDPLMDDLGEFDFGGYEFRVLSVTYDPSGYLTLFDTEENGEILNDSLYKRNREIEDRFNMKFVAEEIGTYADNLTALQNGVNANEDIYDMIQLINRNAFTAALEGQLMPVSALTHVNPEKDYYLHDVNDQLTINGKSVLLYSEECIHALQASCVLVFNKQIAADYQLANYYDLVREGKWTMDYMFNDARKVTVDLDGNTYWNTSDQYGLIGCADFIFASFYNGAGELAIRKNEDGIPYFAAASSEKMADIFAKVLNERDAGEHIRINDKSNWKSSLAEFQDNVSLFCAITVGRMNSLREMEGDFGLLPFPKYDEEQDRYYTRMADGWLHVVPITNTDPERTSVILEALASGSARYVVPTYYQSSFNMKILRDEDSIEMMDIIRSTRILDLGECPWYETVRGPYTYQVFMDRSEEFASFNASIAPKVEKLISDTIATLEDLD